MQLLFKMNDIQVTEEITENLKTSVLEEHSVHYNEKQTVLLVEDNPENRDIVRMYLKKYYDITEAVDGITALALASKTQFNLVLMDIDLGEGIDGIETMHKLREIDYYKTVPVVAVTAYVMAGDREKLLNSGFDSYLPKPFTKDVLIDTVKKCLFY